jgi:hypothetical protein
MLCEEYSNNSAATVPGHGAKDEEPDIVVNHVATVDLKMPTSQQSKRHYVHRAGKKVYHYCTALIAELKPAPSRSLTGEAHEAEVGSGLRAAQSDLLEYCAAYFECHPKEKSVIALAAAGPFWKWTLVYRKYVLEWNWIVNEPAGMKGHEVARWHERFGNPPFVLGTESSDEELTQLNKHHIYKMLVDGHTPEIPIGLQ